MSAFKADQLEVNEPDERRNIPDQKQAEHDKMDLDSERHMTRVRQHEAKRQELKQLLTMQRAGKSFTTRMGYVLTLKQLD